MKSPNITWSRKLGNTARGARLRTLGAGMLVSGALVFGACGDGNDHLDDAATPVAGAGSTLTTGVQTAQVGPTSTGPTSTGPTAADAGSPASRPTTKPDSTADLDAITAVLEEQFATREWYTAVTDIQFDDSDLVVTVNNAAVQLADTQLQAMCDDVAKVTFSTRVDDKIDALRVEDETGKEIARATDADDCTVA